MSKNTIYPQGVVSVSVPATESIAISNFGGGIASIYYLIENANRPAAYQFQQTLEDSSVTLGAFSVDTIVKIEAGNSRVIYEIGTAPSTATGDADTLGGEIPSYYATDSEVVHNTGAENVDGVKTFRNNMVVSQAYFQILTTHGDAEPKMRLSGSNISTGLGGASATDSVVGRQDVSLWGSDNTTWLRAGNGAWDGAGLRMGSYRLWVDATGALRIKSGAPASDLDGTVVGTQT